MFALFTRKAQKPATPVVDRVTIGQKALSLAERLATLKAELIAKRKAHNEIRESWLALQRIKAENRVGNYTEARMTLDSYRAWDAKVTDELRKLNEADRLANGGTYFSWQIEAGIPAIDAEIARLEAETDALMRQAGVTA